MSKNNIIKKLFMLLAVTDALAIGFKNGLKDYISFFKNKQSAFLGERKTYDPIDETTIVDESMASNVLVQTTVREKLDWLKDSSTEYINTLFSQEATNASGLPKAELIVDGISWGVLSSLELLRLKSLLESGDFKAMYSLIPVRSDTIQWEEAISDPTYVGRAGIFESPLITYQDKTTDKESFILPDPNIGKLGNANYTPQIATKTTTRILGNQSRQAFVGLWSQRERAELLKRIDKLHVAVIETLKVANDCAVIESEITGKKLFDYIHGN